MGNGDTSRSVRFIPPVLLIGFLVLSTFFACSKKIHLASVGSNQYPITEKVRSDSLMNAMIAPYRDSLVKEMNEVIGYASAELALGQPESPLGNLLADMLFMEVQHRYPYKLDFALLNVKGIRQPQLPQGNITKGYFFELIPFDNQAVVLALDSLGIMQLVTHIYMAGGWPVSNQIYIHGTSSGPETILFDGKALTGNRTYAVAMPDYVANGGDGCHFLRSYPQWHSGKFMRDLFISHTQNLTSQGLLLFARVDGRFKKEP
ncbi:MAG: 5'-nucleotidase C-terminal domain-containing protein [Saprospiraceae bacterium]|nr:5'-nucleotidase C-terminal domain-containing protein [Saprospiraceae bacterium]